jgi:asparagine synthetase B (glutamine-hydrolysing)
VKGTIRPAISKELPSPLCCLVSGGLDSSLILALAKQHKPDVVAYTAFHNTQAADLRRAREVCRLFGVELREVYVPETR